MWGTSSPNEKLKGDLGNAIEATQIGGRRSDRLMAGNLTPGNFGLLQHNRHQANISLIARIVGFWQIVLQKSFCTGDQKFSGL